MNVIKGLLGGIAAGFGVAVLSFVLAFAVELLNCLSCGCFQSYECRAQENALYKRDSSCPAQCSGVFPIWSGGHFGKTCVVCLIIGVVAGSIYGIATQEQENRRRRLVKEQAAIETSSKRRQEYATSFLHKANTTGMQCDLNRGEGEKILLRPKIESDSLQENLWNAAHDASVPLQKLEDHVASLRSDKEGEGNENTSV